MLISTRILAIVAASLALAGVTAALASTSGQDESASANGSVKRATELLEGNRLTAYINGRTTETTIDRSADFCPGGRFFYESNSTFYEGGAFQQQRGRWRVAAASIRGDSGWAKVRWEAGGDAGTNKIVVNDRGVSVDGYPVEVTSSSVC
jgi:hypothetical protein